MNDLWFNPTIFALIIQLVVFYSRLGYRMITHPGFLFAAIWLFSVFSQQILMKLDFALIRDLDSIEELNIFVFFTSLFFTIWIIIMDKSDNGTFEINLNINLPLFKKLIIVTLIGSFLLMLIQWYFLGISSLNIAQIRDLNTNDKTKYFGTESNPLVSLLKYTQFFYPLISILSGYLLGYVHLLKRNIEFDKKYLYLAILISFFYVLSTGGRNPLFVGIKYYIIGICFVFPSVMSKSFRNWLLKRIIIISVGLIFFSTLVNDARREYSEDTAYSKEFDDPILSTLSGGIEYAGAHYYGYQLRNKDTYDKNRLGYGYYTFYSIFDLSLPFSNYHGIKNSLGKFLGFNENPIDYFYLWDNKREGYYTTNSVYLDLKLDFGFYGTIVFLFLYTYYTQQLFIKVRNRKQVTIYTVFWFSLCFEFWAASNFKSSYASGLIGGIIMTLLFSNFFIYKKLKFAK